jgi:hypothetical protein
MEQSTWIPYGLVHGILRDLVRIVINAFKHNLIPLFVYNKVKKKMHSSRIEPRAWEHMQTGTVAD